MITQSVDTRPVVGIAPAPDGISVDALLPPAMAMKAEQLGVKKATLDAVSLFVLAVLAGAFIALGAIFATTISAGGITINTAEGARAFATGLPYGVIRLLSGLVFSLGLILVIVGGAELFTGNNLIVMAWASGKVKTSALLRNWIIVYVGNFVGSLATAGIMFYTQQYTFGNGSIGAAALNTANAKTGLDFVQAIALGIMCNALVCLAVWLCYSARTTTDKILAIIPPITAFVAAGFEHSIANMYFIPMGLFIRAGAPDSFWTTVGKTAADFGNLTWDRFLLNNLLPVTLGNIIGGAVMVGAVYWFVYLRKK
ncbi:MAG TPA: formate transporter FocA [Anaerolineae bacterium]|nr:formate transporter FocA [Anaerolineae bacterium]